MGVTLIRMLLFFYSDAGEIFGKRLKNLTSSSAVTTMLKRKPFVEVSDTTQA
jgi:hypothetical protein